MSPEEARELFSASIDGELTDERARDFAAALARDETLASEFRAFSDFYARLRHGASSDGDHRGQAPAPDLLPGVQQRLRLRSRGRYYNDRFSERLGVGARTPVILATLMLILLVLAWLGLSLFDAGDAAVLAPR
jgi:anti-sigma factor RsiW